jgi:hypothetical protein
MATQQDEIVSRLQDQYEQLNGQRDAVFAAASPFTADQRTTYVSAVNQSLTNYLTAFNNLLRASDDELKHISDAAMAAQNTLNNSLKDLTTLASKIGLVASALQIVAQALTVID